MPGGPGPRKGGSGRATTPTGQTQQDGSPGQLGRRAAPGAGQQHRALGSQAPERGEGRSTGSATPSALCCSNSGKRPAVSLLGPPPPQEKRQQQPVATTQQRTSVTEHGEPSDPAAASDTRRTVGEPLAHGPGKQGHVALGFPHMQCPPQRQKNPGVAVLGGAGSGESGEALRHGHAVPFRWW